MYDAVLSIGDMYINVHYKNFKQAGAELYQAQFKLGLAKHGLSSSLRSYLYLAKHLY